MMPDYDPRETRAEIMKLSRSPFQRLVARIMDNQPSDSALADIANEHPDRWGQTLALVSRLAGYNEKLDLDLSVEQKVGNMSDAELRVALTRMGIKVEEMTEE